MLFRLNFQFCFKSLLNIFIVKPIDIFYFHIRVAASFIKHFSYNFSLKIFRPKLYLAETFLKLVIYLKHRNNTSIDSFHLFGHCNYIYIWSKFIQQVIQQDRTFNITDSYDYIVSAVPFNFSNIRIILILIFSLTDCFYYLFGNYLRQKCFDSIGIFSITLI